MTVTRKIWNDPAAIIGLLLVGLLLSALNWLYMSNLWSDASWWIAQSDLVAQGHWPYRDFTWLYPPLSLWVFAAAFRVFGSKFYVANALLDVLSMAIVLQMWSVARRLAGRRMAFLLAVAFACVFATRGSMVFFLGAYSSSLLVGMWGSLIALGAALDLIAEERAYFPRLRFILGCNIGLLSKPEYMVGTAVLLMTLLVWMPGGRNLRGLWRWIGLSCAAVLPSAAVYCWVASVVTWGKLLEGVGAYGMARAACPWWPTGYGIIVNLAALGRGILLVVLLEAVIRRGIPRDLRGRVLGWIVAGLALAMLQIVQLRADPSLGRSLLLRIGYWLWDPNTLLLPLMAVSLLAMPWLIWRAVRGRLEFPAPHAAAFCVVFAHFFLMGVRGWFSGSIENVPAIAAAAAVSSFLVMPGIYAMTRSRMFGSADDSLAARQEQALSALLILVAISSVAVTFLGTKSRWATVLETRAGPIRLGNISSGRQVYAYIAARLPEGESVLELPYAGGLSFAARLRNPLYQNQHHFLRITQQDALGDVERYQKQPPRFAMVLKGPGFQTYYGKITGCTFPNFSFAPPLVLDESYVFPIVAAVERDYRVVADFGDRAVLEYAPRR